MMRSGRNIDAKANSDATATRIRPESKVIQSAKDDSDINVIVKRFQKTGLLPVARTMPTYGDFDGVSDYRTALDIVNAADKSFEALPSEIRRRFANSPQAFLEFVHDPANFDEMVKMGLASKPDEIIMETPTTKESDNGQSGKDVGKSGEASGGRVG